MTTPRRYGLLLLCVLAAVYGRACGYGLLLWDDDVWWEDALRGRSLTDAVRASWTEPLDGVLYPLTRLSWWVDGQLGWGLEASHGVSIVLFLLLVYSVGALATRVYGPGAWAVVSLWALHPRHVETVVWLSARKELLSVMPVAGGVLAATAGYWRVAALLWCVAVAAKAPVVTLVVAVVFGWLAIPKVTTAAPRQRLVSMLPAALLSLALLTAMTSAGSHGWVAPADAVARALALQWHWHVMALGLAPPAAIYVVEVHTISVTLGLMVSVAWGLWWWRGPGSLAERTSMVLLWWLPLLPYSGVLSMSFWGADRHLLIPLLGLLGAAALTVRAYPRRWPVRGVWLLAALFWTAQSGVRVGHWATDVDLWEADAARSGSHWMRSFKLGMAHARLGAFEPAAEALSVAYDQKPEHDEVAARLVLARLALGGWNRELQQIGETMVPAPGTPLAWMQVSEALFRLERKEEAAFCYFHCRARWGEACTPMQQKTAQ